MSTPLKKLDGCHVQTILLRNHGLSNGSIYLEFKCEFCGLLIYLRFSFKLLLDLTEKWKRPEIAIPKEVIIILLCT